jgi:PhnB protein
MSERDFALIPNMVVSNASAAIEFYKKALGFEEIGHSMKTPDGKVIHAELRRDGNWIFLADAFPDMGPGSCVPPEKLGGTTITLHLGVKDVDADFAKAVSLGAKSIMPPKDMFWGDRYCKISDPFGHHWSLSTRKETLTPEEVEKRAAAFFANWGKKK